MLCLLGSLGVIKQYKISSYKILSNYHIVEFIYLNFFPFLDACFLGSRQKNPATDFSFNAFFDTASTSSKVNGQHKGSWNLFIEEFSCQVFFKKVLISLIILLII